MSITSCDDSGVASGGGGGQRFQRMRWFRVVRCSGRRRRWCRQRQGDNVIQRVSSLFGSCFSRLRIRVSSVRICSGILRFGFGSKAVRYGSNLRFCLMFSCQ
ncbi:hypothetical protein HanPI659440_Chr03g0125271 [Helianthus annuus]|nr:hypothetical protein HanPI659440_Chr03g0125271 [Helianthus annuus]